MPIYRPSTGSYDITVRGTGDADDDHDLLSAAVTALNANGRGTLIIDGDVKVKSSHAFTEPISIRGRDAGASLTVTNTSNSFMAFTWNATWTATGATSYAVSTDSTFSETITSAAHAPEKGDWIVVWSEDKIPDTYWHDATYEPRPAELHQVAYFDATNDLIYVANGFVVDQLTTTPKMAIVPMDRNVTVRDLHVTHAGVSGQYPSLFYFNCIDGLVVENIHSDRDAPGCIWATNSANVRFHGINLSGSERNELSYGTICGLCNGFMLCDSEFYGTRHPFSTTSAWTGTTPYRRYGTPLNVLVDNVQVCAYTKRDLDPGVISYRTGSGAATPSVGATVQGDTTGATGTIVSITVDSGTFVAGTAAGEMVVGTITGQFLATENFSFSGGQTATNIPLARQSLSTHPEGYGVKFSNCTMHVAGDWDGNSGAYFRARNTEMCGCTIRGAGITLNYGHGLYVQGANARISNCLFENLYSGIEVNDGSSDSTQRSNGMEVSNCTFRNCRGQGIWARYGSNHNIHHNTFINCGSYEGSGRYKAPVQLDDGDGHRVIGNDIPNMSANSYSVYLGGTLGASDVTVIDNVCEGYGSGVVGFGGTNAAAAETAWDAYNHTTE